MSLAYEWVYVTNNFFRHGNQFLSACVDAYVSVTFGNLHKHKKTLAPLVQNKFMLPWIATPECKTGSIQNLHSKQAAWYYSPEATRHGTWENAGERGRVANRWRVLSFSVVRLSGSQKVDLWTWHYTTVEIPRAIIIVCWFYTQIDIGKSYDKMTTLTKLYKK